VAKTSAHEKHMKWDSRILEWKNRT